MSYHMYIYTHIWLRGARFLICTGPVLRVNGGNRFLAYMASVLKKEIAPSVRESVLKCQGIASQVTENWI